MPGLLNRIPNTCEIHVTFKCVCCIFETVCDFTFRWTTCRIKPTLENLVSFTGKENIVQRYVSLSQVLQFLLLQRAD